MKTIRDIWNDLRCKIKYHTTKDFRGIIKAARSGFPWDEGYLYDLERAKLTEMLHYHQKYQRFVGWERVVRDISLCLSLIDIFTGKRDLFHYDRSVLEYVSVTLSGEDAPAPKYICDVRVNTRNLDRFLVPGTPEYIRQMYLENPHELYELKAKHLYHKIRLERDAEWWD